MDIPRALRKELDAISKEVLGSSSKWQKFLKEGTRELVTRTKVEVVPANPEKGTPETTREVQEPVLNSSGKQQFTQKYWSLDEIKARLLELKVKRDEILAAIKKQQDEQAAKKAHEEQIQKVKEAAHGSAL